MANNIVEVKIDGLDELEAKLYELPSKFARKAMRQAIAPAIKLWKDEIQSRALQGEYATGFMASQVATKITTRARDESGTGMVGFSTKQNPAKHGGATAANEAFWKELGTAKQPARPFMRPAFESKASAVLDVFTSQLKELLTEVFGA